MCRCPHSACLLSAIYLFLSIIHVTVLLEHLIYQFFYVSGSETLVHFEDYCRMLHQHVIVKIQDDYFSTSILHFTCKTQAATMSSKSWNQFCQLWTNWLCW